MLTTGHDRLARFLSATALFVAALVLVNFFTGWITAFSYAVVLSIADWYRELLGAEGWFWFRSTRGKWALRLSGLTIGLPIVLGIGAWTYVLIRLLRREFDEPEQAPQTPRQ